MNTELEVRREVFNIATGEVLDLATADSGDVAHALFAIREKEAELKAMKQELGKELHRRLDANASWTEHMGAFQVKGTSPQPTREADLGPLMEVLEGLIQSGLVSAKAAEKAIETKLTYSVRWGALDALRKLGGEVKERIDPHIREVEKRRYAPSVTMVGGSD